MGSGTADARDTWFASVLDAAPEACLVLDREFRVVLANQRCLELNAMRLENMVGRTHWELWPASVGSIAETSYRQVVEQQVTVEFEQFYPPYDAWFSIKAAPLPDGVCIFFHEITERKRTQQALEESEARFRDLMEQAPFSVQILHPSGETLWINPAFERLWGLKYEDLRDYNILQDPQLEALGLAAFLRRAFDGETVSLPESKYDATDVATRGRPRTVSSVAFPVKDATGRVVEVVLTHTDVSEAAEAMHELRENRQRLDLALTSARAGVWEWDLEANVATWSPELFRLVGVEPKPIVEASEFTGLIHPDDRARVLARSAEVIADGSTLDEEFRAVLPDGSVRWFSSIGRLIRDESGRPVRLIGINQDIHARRTAEEKLHRTQESLALAMKGSRLGWWTRDLVTGIVEWSPELELLFGLAVGSFAGLEQDFLDFVLPEDRAAVRGAVEQAIQKGNDYSIEFRFRHTDGSVRWMEGRGKATYDATGRPVRLDGIGVDVTERREAAEALRESEARYRRLADSVPSFVWTARPDGVVDFLNRRWREFTGLPADADLAAVQSYAVHPDDVGRIVPEWERAVAERKTYRTELRYRRHDGEYRWFLSQAEPVHAEDGTFQGWFGTSVDIHDRRRAEEELRLIIDTMPQIAWSLRGDGEVDYVNRRYLEYTGRAETADVEINWAEIVHPDDLALARTTYAASVRSGWLWEHELRLRRRDGVYRWHLSRLGPLRDIDGHVLRWFGTSTDIHDQKTKEATLDFLVRLTEATRRMEDPTEIMAVTVDRLGRHLGVSRCAYAEMEDDNDHFVIEQDYCDGCESIAGRYPLRAFGARAYDDLRNGRPYVARDVDAELRRPQDLETYRATNIKAVVCVSLVKEGQMRALMAIHQTEPRDWTPDEIELLQMVADRCWEIIERARSDRRLRELNTDLERRVDERTAELLAANEEMEGFTYTVSHDLRAPLRAVVATSSILLEDAGDRLEPEHQELLRRQAHNARRLGVLIDELLQLSRLGRQEVVRKPFDLSFLAQEVANEIVARGDAGMVQIEIEPRLLAEGDSRLVKFVLLNLLENAVKFSPNGGTIRVGKRDGAFFVSDEGIGFDMQYAHKLFRPFERLVTDEAFPGTGIGLANVWRIVQRHGGSAWAYSEPGKGATFFFSLPTA